MAVVGGGMCWSVVGCGGVWQPHCASDEGSVS